ncbi:restriction endonuclease subunit S [Methanosarcina sp. 2.H.A.1B.4]|uniref:restriction endonuclease subunit S n=1 Tax=Methanosarcina sp. 2.H.A.1B.4 TaxID=1483600 RepID=UPI000621E001|nr:restriction endonuclease subunit S [Methanosarcina sp. 2.H.A.1B.4]KKG10324.1 hypothetical protein EO92_03845 [Methanosarcina sp. 2.H.A.1B.4]
MTKNVSVPEGYKKTELGMIPEEWEVISLKEITDFHKQGYYTKEKYVENGVKFLRITDIDNRGNIKNETMPSLNISKTDYENYKLESGDFAFARSGAIGRVGLVRNNEEAIFGSYIIKFKFNQEVTDNEFFIRYFNGDIFRKELFKMIQGASNQNVNAENIKRCNIILPTLKEQQKIASILSKVDEQIEQTEQIIEKTEFLKKGLMQKLLTKGIGHTKFKKTEFGEIPEEWDVGKLSKISQVVMGQSPTGDTYNTTGEGKPLINGPSEFNERYPTPVKWTSKPTKVCNRGDILFCVRGNTLGRMNFADQEYCIGRGIAAIRGLKNLGDTNFVHMLLTKEGTELYRRANGEGSTFPNIKRDQLNEIKIAVPSLTEQQKIASILSKVDSQIQDNQNYLTRLQELKKGLMQDLLTGKVRVCV